MNRLAGATSPYLLQHKDNPVAWQEWGAEAFAEARRRDVPLFVSIGYATCHWCHVMAHESFEDPDVARALEAFVAVKVDREERPDVDELYMAACQLFTGRGGWPLTVFLDHDGRPFFAGTYFPKEDRGHMVGLLSLLTQVQAAWHGRRKDLVHQADHVLQRLGTAPKPGVLGPSTLDACEASLMSRHDAQGGGFGSAPKFPSCHNLLFLLRRHARHPSAPPDAVVGQLEAMHRGGIHDHLGGGFHRYSTDARWLLPHFEKMLYDQAMAAMAGTEAWQASGHPVARSVATSALDYVLADLQDPAGGFWSAQDADSEGEEGRYYVWSHDQVLAGLDTEGGADAALFAAAYGVERDGNFLDEATHRKTGTNVLWRARDDTAAAKAAGVPVAEVPVRLASARALLLDERRRRVPPQTDDKVLADWNGLTVAALAKAGTAFRHRPYIDAARRAAAFARQTLWNDGRLRHSHRSGTTRPESFLSDHAYMLWGALELYQATFDPAMLGWAQDLAAGLEAFQDEATAGAWTTSPVGMRLASARVEAYDGALPAPAGIAAWNLARLSDMDGDPRWAGQADRALRALGGDAAKHPAAYVGLHLAVDWLQGPTTQVLAVGDGFTAPVREGYRPHTVLLKQAPGLAKVAPWTAPMSAPGAYVCKGNTCDRPVKDPRLLAAALG